MHEALQSAAVSIKADHLGKLIAASLSQMDRDQALRRQVEAELQMGGPMPISRVTTQLDAPVSNGEETSTIFKSITSV